MCQALCRLGPQWCLCTLRLQPCRHAQCQPLTMVSQQEAALLPSVCVSACRLASEQPPGGGLLQEQSRLPRAGHSGPGVSPWQQVPRVKSAATRTPRGQKL